MLAGYSPDTSSLSVTFGGKKSRNNFYTHHTHTHTPFLFLEATMVNRFFFFCYRYLVCFGANSQQKQLDKLLGLAMLIVASAVFLYYTTWTILMVTHPPPPSPCACLIFLLYPCDMFPDFSPPLRILKRRLSYSFFQDMHCTPLSLLRHASSPLYLSFTMHPFSIPLSAIPQGPRPFLVLRHALTRQCTPYHSHD